MGSANNLEKQAVAEAWGAERPGKITGFCSKCNEKPLKGFKEGTGKWFTCIKDHPGCCVAGAIRGRDCWEGLV